MYTVTEANQEQDRASFLVSQFDQAITHAHHSGQATTALVIDLEGESAHQVYLAQEVAQTILEARAAAQEDLERIAERQAEILAGFVFTGQRILLNQAIKNQDQAWGQVKRELANVARNAAEMITRLEVALEDGPALDKVRTYQHQFTILAEAAR